MNAGEILGLLSYILPVELEEGLYFELQAGATRSVMKPPELLLFISGFGIISVQQRSSYARPLPVERGLAVRGGDLYKIQDPTTDALTLVMVGPTAVTKITPAHKLSEDLVISQASTVQVIWNGS
jgi:hypothetical protein